MAAEFDEIAEIDGTARFEGLPTAERLKAFADAVVAIAMTLLILPLLETVTAAAEADLTTAEWLDENFGPVFAFVLSFGIIAMFWVNHHRLFARVEHVSAGLLWITIAWMLTIVWLPVATAMTGQMTPDALQKALYIGSMVVTCLLLLCARWHLRAHPELHDISAEALRRGVLVDLVTASLFVVSLVVAIAVPPLGYYSLFLMSLVGVVHRVLMRITHQRQAAD